MAKTRKMPEAYTHLIYCVEALSAAHRANALTEGVMQMYADAIEAHARELARYPARTCAAARHLEETLEAANG